MVAQLRSTCKPSVNIPFKLVRVSDIPVLILLSPDTFPLDNTVVVESDGSGPSKPAARLRVAVMTRAKKRMIVFIKLITTNIAKPGATMLIY